MTRNVPILGTLPAPALGIALALALFSFVPGSARAASKHTSHEKKHVVHHTKTRASHEGSPRLQGIAYKTIATRKRHVRRRRVWRHHVVLPKQPSRDRTEQIQETLERSGFYTGEPNGKWDSSMAESLRRFQAANGLPPTGKLDALSLQKMGLGSDVAGVSAPRPATQGNSNSSASPSSSTPKNPGK